jgi:hypothetical protein
MTDPAADEDAIDLSAILSPAPDLSVAVCAACLAAGTTPPRELPLLDSGGYDSDAAARHCISKHALATENVTQFITDYRVNDANRMTFETRVLTR